MSVRQRATARARSASTRGAAVPSRLSAQVIAVARKSLAAGGSPRPSRDVSASARQPALSSRLSFVEISDVSASGRRAQVAGAAASAAVSSSSAVSRSRAAVARSAASSRASAPTTPPARTRWLASRNAWNCATLDEPTNRASTASAGDTT
ncbi:MAG: hypothetical protein NT062_24345 [Proteobacteria bacterium]|nr:hypothetical protein [Pseudomonadota bacterium]